MDLWDLTRLLFRRWYFVLPLLVLSAVAAVVTGLSVSPDYSATGHLQLIPPSVPSETAEKAGRPRNPWADLGLEQTGSAAIIKVQSKAVVDQLVAGGFTDSFTITMEGAGIIRIETIGDTPQQASGSVRELMRLLDQSIASEQQRYRVNAPDSITTLALDEGGNVVQVNSTVRRALVAVVGLGMILTVAATIALDAWLRRRTRRRSAAEPTGSAAPGRVNGGAELTSVLLPSADREVAPAPATASPPAAAGPVGTANPVASSRAADADRAAPYGRPGPRDGGWPVDARPAVGKPAQRPPVEPATLTVEFQQSGDTTAPIPLRGAATPPREVEADSQLREAKAPPGRDEETDEDGITSIIAVVPPESTIVLPVLDASWAARDGKSERW